MFNLKTKVPQKNTWYSFLPVSKKFHLHVLEFTTTHETVRERNLYVKQNSEITSIPIVNERLDCCNDSSIP